MEVGMRKLRPRSLLWEVVINEMIPTYEQRLIQIFGTDLKRYWPLEIDATEKVVGELNTPTGITYVNGMAQFNGTSSNINIFQSALAAALTFREVTISLEAQVNGQADWSDATYRSLFYFRTDNSNYVWAFKSPTANFISIIYQGAGAAKELDVSLSTLNKFRLTMTYSNSNGRLRFYINDSMAIAEWPMTANYTGPIIQARIGSDNAGTAFFWKGGIGRTFVAAREATAAEVADFARPFELRGVTAVGDSKTSGSIDDAIGGRIGWPAWLVDGLTTSNTVVVETHRVGVGGIDSAGMKVRSAADAAALAATYPTQPRDIIIGLGANDAVIASPPNQATFEANMMSICNDYHTACPNARIWLTLCYRPAVQVYLDAVVNAGILHMISTTAWLRQGIDERVVLPGLLVDDPPVHPGHPGHLAYAAAYAALIA
jgi:hypothetical protein